MDDALAFASIGTLAAQIRAGAVKPVALAEAFLARIKGPACSGEPLVKKVKTKLRTTIAKVRMRVRKADAKTKSPAIIALLRKAGDFVDVARGALASAVASHALSAPCGAELDEFLRSLDECIGFLPKTP